MCQLDCAGFKRERNLSNLHSRSLLTKFHLSFVTTTVKEIKFVIE